MAWKNEPKKVGQKIAPQMASKKGETKMAP